MYASLSLILRVDILEYKKTVFKGVLKTELQIKIDKSIPQCYYD